MTAEINPDAVEARIDEESEFDLIDIRDPDAYEDGHVPGAVNVQLSELEDAVDEREWADEVVVACYVGESSVQAARFLDAATDADVASMAGGYDAWSGPLVAADDAEASD